MNKSSKALSDKSLLNNRSFGFFLTVRTASTLASQMAAVAVGWQIYAMTGSAFILGMVGLVQFLPMFVLTLLIGHTADRFNKRSIIFVCQVVEGIGLFILAAGSFSGWINTEIILIVLAFLGAARAFEGPSMNALLPGIVPAEKFPRAAALSASAFQAASIIGPALGGIFYTFGAVIVYSVICLLYFISCFLTSRIHQILKQEAKEPFSFKSLFGGIHFIINRPVILGAISLDLFAVLLGGATALLPIYARDILLTGPWGLGLLRAAPAIGALLISLYLTKNPIRRHIGRSMFTAVIIFGAATLVFALSRSFFLSLASLAVLGGSDVISVVIRQTLVQIKTPDNMRGRVSAVNSLFIGTSNQLGEFESGITAAWFGTIPSVVIGGISTIAVVLAWTRLFPDLFKADSFEH